MKRLTIGRNPGCDIVYDQKMVSRNHALLNVYSSGKYEIINMGTNGTKVNGTLISNGQPYPVKRGDSVVFAGQCHLDWKQVPNPRRPMLITGIIVGAVLVMALVVGGILLAMNHDWGSGSDSDYYGGGYDDRPALTDSVTAKDSTEVEVKDVTIPGDLKEAEKLLEEQKSGKGRSGKAGGKKSEKNTEKNTVDKDNKGDKKSDSNTATVDNNNTAEDDEWSR